MRAPQTNLDPGLKLNSVGGIGSGKDSDLFRKGLKLAQKVCGRISDWFQKSSEGLQSVSEGFLYQLLQIKFNRRAPRLLSHTFNRICAVE